MTGVVLQMLHQLKTLLPAMTVTGIQAPLLYPSGLDCLTVACIGIAALWHGRAFAYHKHKTGKCNVIRHHDAETPT